VRLTQLYYVPSDGRDGPHPLADVHVSRHY